MSLSYLCLGMNDQCRIVSQCPFYSCWLWCFGEATETHTWVTGKTGVQQLICFVGNTMSQEALRFCVCVRAHMHISLCVCVLASECLYVWIFVCVWERDMCMCVCRWQLQPRTDWHLAVAVVLTAELTALIRTHPNQKETTPVHCSWAQPGEEMREGGGEEGREGERKGGRERWRAEYEWRPGVKEMERGVIRSRWWERRWQREVGGEGGGGEERRRGRSAARNEREKKKRGKREVWGRRKGGEDLTIRAGTLPGNTHRALSPWAKQKGAVGQARREGWKQRDGRKEVNWWMEGSHGERDAGGRLERGEDGGEV